MTIKSKEYQKLLVGLDLLGKWVGGISKRLDLLEKRIDLIEGRRSKNPNPKR